MLSYSEKIRKVQKVTEKYRKPKNRKETRMTEIKGMALGNTEVKMTKQKSVAKIKSCKNLGKSEQMLSEQGKLLFESM